MNYSLIPRQEIEKARIDEKIIRETAGQVIKDFAAFGMEIRFPADLRYAYDELFDQLSEYMGHLLHSETEKLSALLYHIDLDESKFTDENGSSYEHEHERLSDLILNREFLKVLTRHYFKDHPEKL